MKQAAPGEPRPHGPASKIREVREHRTATPETIPANIFRS